MQTTSGIGHIRTVIGVHEIVLPPVERARHDEIAVEKVLISDGSGRTLAVADAAVVKTPAPLDRYFRRRQINGLQYKAGKILRATAHHAGMTPRTVVNLEAEIRGAGGSAPGFIAASERIAEARDRLRGAVRAAGRILWPVLSYVVLDEHSAGDWAHAHSKPTAHGLPTLIVALDVLVDHFALKQEARR